MNLISLLLLLLSLLFSTSSHAMEQTENDDRINKRCVEMLEQLTWMSVPWWPPGKLSPQVLTFQWFLQYSIFFSRGNVATLWHRGARVIYASMRTWLIYFHNFLLVHQVVSCAFVLHMPNNKVKKL